MTEYITSSAKETEALGEKLAQELNARVFALEGGLGAGKTTFVKGFARAYGYLGPVLSPTYAIVNEYYGSLTVCHFDLYRLGSIDELYDIGWEDYLNSNRILIIEWSEKVPEALPKAHCRIRLEPVSESVRRVTVTCMGGGL